MVSVCVFEPKMLVKEQVFASSKVFRGFDQNLKSQWPSRLPELAHGALRTERHAQLWRVQGLDLTWARAMAEYASSEPPHLTDRKEPARTATKYLRKLASQFCCDDGAPPRKYETCAAPLVQRFIR